MSSAILKMIFNAVTYWREFRVDHFFGCLKLWIINLKPFGWIKWVERENIFLMMIMMMMMMMMMMKGRRWWECQEAISFSIYFDSLGSLTLFFISILSWVKEIFFNNLKDFISLTPSSRFQVLVSKFLFSSSCFQHPESKIEKSEFRI